MRSAIESRAQKVWSTNRVDNHLAKLGLENCIILYRCCLGPFEDAAWLHGRNGTGVIKVSNDVFRADSLPELDFSEIEHADKSMLTATMAKLGLRIGRWQHGSSCNRAATAKFPTAGVTPQPDSVPAKQSSLRLRASAQSVCSRPMQRQRLSGTKPGILALGFDSDTRR